MKKYRITKISRSEDLPGGLRTESVEGFLQSELEVGMPAIMWAKPLEDLITTARFISTSIVLKIEKNDDDTRSIYTQSGSVYKIEDLGEVVEDES